MIRRAGRLAAWAALLALLAAPLPAAALSLIRDAEIEATLARMTNPVLRAAGMRPGDVNLYIVNDPSLNAFVAGGRNMFLHTGLITELESPDQLIGVIAHETGHLAGGHQARRSVALRSAEGPALIAMLAGLLAGAAAGSPEAGAAVSAGSQGALARAFLRYNRGEEAAADQAALRYLDAVEVDPRGLYEVLEMFRGQEVFQAGNRDPYVLTHPLSTERMSLLERRVAERAPPPDDPERLYWFERMQAKLSGFLDPPRRVLNRLADEADSEPVLYARAVARHRLPAPREALATVDRLLEMRPDDPYYLELKGQMLFESGRPAEAVPLYRRAVAEAPDRALIKTGLGRALLALGTPEADREALSVLEAARGAEPGDAGALRALATAHARAGNDGMAALATAERFALSGRIRDAQIHARRAEGRLARGSPGWLRAEDILALDPPER